MFLGDKLEEIANTKLNLTSSVVGPRTELVAQIEFTEWTPDGHLRHSRFVGLREDKEAGGIVREPGS
jgi:ATP-dependent DNA ligase